MDVPILDPSHVSVPDHGDCILDPEARQSVQDSPASTPGRDVTFLLKQACDTFLNFTFWKLEEAAG